MMTSDASVNPISCPDEITGQRPSRGTGPRSQHALHA